MTMLEGAVMFLCVALFYPTVALGFVFVAWVAKKAGFEF